jgi:glycerol-3-phosphate dehydrogenase
MVFVIPFEDRYTLIGTTDTPADENDLDHPKISHNEMDYLLDAANLYFTHQSTQDDIVYTYAGVRPLYDDGSTEASRVTRDYHLTLEDNCLTVFGGKITTFRRLAEEAVDMMLTEISDEHPFGGVHWTAKAILPGGDIPDSLSVFTQEVIETYPFLPEELATRLASQYGSRIHDFLDKASSLTDLGVYFGDGLYAREVDFLVANEWARKADDILLRRTRIGMHVSEETKQNLTEYLKITRY